MEQQKDRLYLRLPVDWKIQILEWGGEKPEESIPVKIKNGNVEGLLIELDRPAETSEVFVASLEVEGRSIELYAIVRWSTKSEPYQAGVEFFYCDKEDEEYFSRFADRFK